MSLVQLPHWGRKDHPVLLNLMIRSTLIYRNTLFKCSGILPRSHLIVRGLGSLDIWHIISHSPHTGWKDSCSPAKPDDLIYTDLQECILWMLRHPAKSSFDYSQTSVIWYSIWNLSLTPHRRKGSSCPAQPHDLIHPDLQAYIVRVIKQPTESSFDHLRAWVIWYLICNLSLTPLRFKGSCSPAQSHDSIYTDIQEYIVQVFRHPTKSSFDYSGALVIWYLICNLSLTPHRQKGFILPC